ncbi:MAG: hypothetical protein LRY56_05615 [Burkholderiaceae bacterium]|nr:hypothetical protein [Burkholderiaceae bacterium]
MSRVRNRGCAGGCLRRHLASLIGAVGFLVGLCGSHNAHAQNLPSATIGNASTSEYYSSVVGTNGVNGQDATYDAAKFECTISAGSSGYAPAEVSALSVNLTATSGLVSGIVVNSQGGAGGWGGNNGNSGCAGVSGADAGAGGNGGIVQVMLNGSQTYPAAAFAGAGLYVQSIGGDGGNGGYSTEGGNGGNGGVGGRGGNVTVTNDTFISTSGSGGYGIWALSAGGWGGSGGGASYWVPTDSTGGSGSAGAAGGSVEANNYGQITTPQSIPIFAQSIGGNGGSGASGNASWAGVIGGGGGGSGGYGGSGGQVMANNLGNLTSYMTGGFGAFAQSLGGGGGAAGASAGLLALGAQGGYGANGSTVWVNSYSGSVIAVGGASSAGLFGQSVGGEGHRRICQWLGQCRGRGR